MFRPMRRLKQQITDAECKEILKNKKCGNTPHKAPRKVAAFIKPMLADCGTVRTERSTSFSSGIIASRAAVVKVFSQKNFPQGKNARFYPERIPRITSLFSSRG